MTPNRIPNLHIIVGACVAAIAGYAAFSVYAVMWLRDATMTGDIIGTWKSFAVLAFGFWLGSSSGGKSNAVPPDGPQDVHITNPPSNPANVQEQL
jgi:hypothetical protein